MWGVGTWTSNRCLHIGRWTVSWSFRTARYTSGGSAGTTTTAHRPPAFSTTIITCTYAGEYEHARESPSQCIRPLLSGLFSFKLWSQVYMYVLTGAGMRPRIDQQISSVSWRGTWTRPSHRVEGFIGTCLYVVPTAEPTARSAASTLASTQALCRCLWCMSSRATLQ